MTFNDPGGRWSSKIAAAHIPSLAPFPRELYRAAPDREPSGGDFTGLAGSGDSAGSTAYVSSSVGYGAILLHIGAQICRALIRGLYR